MNVMVHIDRPQFPPGVVVQAVKNAMELLVEQGYCDAVGVVVAP